MRKTLLALALLALTAAPRVAADDKDYMHGPDSQVQSVPHGKVTKHSWTSKVFPGTVRDYWVYVPAQYDGSTPAALMVFQDGGWYVDEKADFRVPVVFDNLIAKKQMPVTVGVFINPGVVPPVKAGGEARQNRSFEYDTPSDQYARFLEEEILPEVEQDGEAQARPGQPGDLRHQLGRHLRLHRGVGAARPVRQGLSHVGSFTNIRHGDTYPGQIRKTERKPIRVYLQDGSGDLDNLHGNWPLANQEMAAALKFAKYDYEFVYGTGRHSGKHGGAVLPDALRWLWREEKEQRAVTPLKSLTFILATDRFIRGLSSGDSMRRLAPCFLALFVASPALAQDMPLSQVVIDGEGWKVVASGYETRHQPGRRS